MCGRFTLRTPSAKLVEQFQLESTPQLPLRFNIAPTQDVLAVRAESGVREATLLRWGLVPFWAKDLSIGSRMINARAETVTEKPAFSAAFKNRRCLVLSDGYVEWTKLGKQKQPYHIRMQDQRPFAFAGLWAKWKQDDQRVESCTIITTEANELSREVHDRMPAILEPSDYDLWLDPSFGETAPLQEMLRPFPSDEMELVAINPRINNVNNDDEACLREQRLLF